MMPLEFCSHSREGKDLNEENLSIVWFEEGDAAALFQNNKLLAVIPGWAENGFYGYSRYAVGTGPFAWELSDAEDNLYKRVMKSESYWEYLNGDYFKDVQDIHLSAKNNSPKYEKFMGERINLLWVIPITSEEYNFVQDNYLDKLIEKYDENFEKIIIFDEKPKFI